nr:lipopolysaccharide heptosyltransferase II [Desulfobacterales bacterium]
MKNPSNILIVKLSAIGDVIHTLPAVWALREHFPCAHITWLVEEEAADIVKGHEAVDRVLISRRKTWLRGLLKGRTHKNVMELVHFIKTLRDTKYDMVIDFQGLFKSGILVFCSRGTHKIGYDKTRELSYIFLNERVPPFDMDKHAILRYLNLVESIGASTDHVFFRMSIRSCDRERARKLLQTRGWQGIRPLIAIHPMAKWKTKLWPLDRFSKLCSAIQERFGGMVIFTGSKEDGKEVKRIVSTGNSRVIDLSGETDLMRLAAIYELADCVVSTDSGPMHLAAAIGTPVVALFGPTAPWRTGPFGDQHQIVRAGADCSPCFKKTCSSLECMKQITVDQILKSVEAVLQTLAGVDGHAKGCDSVTC